MALWAIIPAKPFGLGKSRLASVLGQPERAALSRRMFDGVIAATVATIGPKQTIVVTTDAALLAEMAGCGLHALPERATGDLNAALAQGTRHALAQGASAILVLPGDLPDITAADVAALTDALGAAPCCAIAPDRADQGTNALALAPPQPDFFRFGPQSFSAHLDAASASGMPVRIVRRPGLAHDLDTPESYRRYADRRRTEARA